MRIREQRKGITEVRRATVAPRQPIRAPGVQNYAGNQAVLHLLRSGIGGKSDPSHASVPHSQGPAISRMAAEAGTEHIQRTCACDANAGGQLCEECAKKRQSQANPAARSSPPIQRKAQCSCGGTCQHCQQQASSEMGVKISQPGDLHEEEADRVADQLLQQPTQRSEGHQIQRATDGGEAQHSSAGPLNDLHGGGSPLPFSSRAFFEPRFHRDFSDVKVHADPHAAESAQSLGALAYTTGKDIVFAAGQFRPESQSGRRLLAHELVHVVQQDAKSFGANPSLSAAEPGTIQRQTVTPSCAANAAIVKASWTRAVTILEATISRLEAVMTMMTEEGGPRRFMSNAAHCIDISFGDVGGLEGGGGFTHLNTIIQNYRLIQGGFAAGRQLRCDGNTLPNNECDWRVAFVVPGNATDVFLCPQFFTDEDEVGRAVTLIHEMAHSVLKIAHKGLPEKTFPPVFFDYDSSALGLEFDEAKRNAFAYEILANCLFGEPPSSTFTAKAPGGSAAATDRPLTVSALGGGSITPALQGLAGLAARYSLRPGSLVVFNPYIGLNVLYSPTTGGQPRGFLTGAGDLGLRIQQPLHGPYLDASLGGFVGYEAPAGDPLKFTGGLTGSLGIGWRWERIEIGPEARASIPLTAGDPNRLIILARVGARF